MEWKYRLLLSFLPEEYKKILQILFLQMLTELKEGNFHDVFANLQSVFKVFRSQFVQLLESQDESLQFNKTLINGSNALRFAVLSGHLEYVKCVLYSDCRKVGEYFFFEYRVNFSAKRFRHNYPLLRLLHGTNGNYRNSHYTWKAHKWENWWRKMLAKSCNMLLWSYCKLVFFSSMVRKWIW